MGECQLLVIFLLSLLHCQFNTAIILGQCSPVWPSCSVSKRLLSAGKYNPKIVNKWPWNICTSWSECYNNPFLVWFKSSINWHLQNLKMMDHCHKYLLLLLWTMWVPVFLMYWLNGVCMDAPFPSSPPPPPHTLLPPTLLCPTLSSPTCLAVKDGKRSSEQQTDQSFHIEE